MKPIHLPHEATTDNGPVGAAVVATAAAATLPPGRPDLNINIYAFIMDSPGRNAFSYTSRVSEVRNPMQSMNFVNMVATP